MRLALRIKTELGTEQRNRHRIVQNAWLIERLMHRATMRHSKRGSAGATRFHKVECR